MKKLLLLFVLFPAVIHAQTYLRTDIGTSIEYRKVGFYIGQQFKNNIIAEGGMDVCLDRIIYHPSFFGIAAGYVLNAKGDFNYTPALGMYYRMQTADVERLNGFSSSIGLRISYDCYYTNIQYINKKPVIGFGLIAFFNR